MRAAPAGDFPRDAAAPGRAGRRWSLRARTRTRRATSPGRDTAVGPIDARWHADCARARVRETSGGGAPRRGAGGGARPRCDRRCAWKLFDRKARWSRGQYLQSHPRRSANTLRRAHLQSHLARSTARARRWLGTSISGPTRRRFRGNPMCAAAQKAPAGDFRETSARSGARTSSPTPACVLAPLENARVAAWPAAFAPKTASASIAFIHVTDGGCHTRLLGCLFN